MENTSIKPTSAERPFFKSTRHECVSKGATACVAMAPKSYRGHLTWRVRVSRQSTIAAPELHHVLESHSSQPEAFPKAAKRFLPLTGGADEDVPAGVGVSDAVEAGDATGCDLQKIQNRDFGKAERYMSRCENYINACQFRSWARSRLRLWHRLWSRADTMGLLKVKQNLQHHEQHDNFGQQFHVCRPASKTPEVWAAV